MWVELLDLLAHCTDIYLYLYHLQRILLFNRQSVLSRGINILEHSVKLPGIAIIVLGFLLVASSFNTSLLSSIKLVGLSSIVILLSVSSLILL